MAETIWRAGDRIRRTNGAGYGDVVPDDDIRRHVRDNAADVDFLAFAKAVLAIREFERITGDTEARRIRTAPHTGRTEGGAR